MFGVQVDNDLQRAMDKAKNDGARVLAHSSIMRRWLQIEDTTGQFRDPANR